MSEQIKKELKEAFEEVWRIFKSTPRASKIQQVKYVANFFFTSGVQFGLKMSEKEPRESR